MFLINPAMESISIGTAALIVVLGMAVVFFGLILLMYVTKIAGAIIGRKKSAAPAAAPAPATPGRDESDTAPKTADAPILPTLLLAALSALVLVRAKKRLCR